jgi:hypothetical protein
LQISRQDLIALKRLLIGARVAALEAAALARRKNEITFASRLRYLAALLADELDGLEEAISRLPP